MAAAVFDQVVSYRDAHARLHRLLSPRHNLPAFVGDSVGPDFAYNMANFILATQPRRVVELGSGACTLVAAYALNKTGTGSLISFTHDQDIYIRTLMEVRRHGLEHIVQIHHAPLGPCLLEGRLQRWYQLPMHLLPQQFDLLLIDGPPRDEDALARYPALPLLWEHMANDAVILIDDSQAMVERWQARYPGLSYEFLPTAEGMGILTRREAY